MKLIKTILTRFWAGSCESREPAKTREMVRDISYALVGEAQRINGNLSPGEEEIARRLFLDLVQSGESAKDTYCRMELKQVVSDHDRLKQVDTAIAHFADSKTRLIALSDNTGAETAEVTYKTLFEHWEHLEEQLNGSCNDLRFQLQLDETGMILEKNGKPKGILWQSSDLTLLRNYHDDFNNNMTFLNIEFFNTSGVNEKMGGYLSSLSIQKLSHRSESLK